MYNNFLKRAIDISVSVLALIMLLPVFLILIVLLTLSYKGNPFFFQLRPGKNERIFKLLKFKTMNDMRDANGQLLPDSARLTPGGRILRKTSLDEIPQLINVLKGDMSLIGPRPLLPRYLPFYSGQERLRHSIRPGITGWAQVNGRNVSSWKDRLAADVYYIKNRSFKLDMLIIIETFRSIFSGKDLIIDPDSFMKPLDIERSQEQHEGAF